MYRNHSSQHLSKDEDREDNEEYNEVMDQYDRRGAVPKQNELKNRLYDKGFSVKTLPSVKRPETSSSTSRPLSAKLFTFKNKLSPLVYQPQPCILSPTQTKKSPNIQDQIKQTRNPGEMMAQTSNKFFGSTFTNFPQKLPQFQIKLQGERQEPVTTEEALPGLGQQNTRQTQSRQALYRPSSTNNLHPLNPLNKLVPIENPNKIVISALRPSTSQGNLGFKALTSANQTGNNFFAQTAQNFGEDNTHSTSDFNTSKKVIDKMSGKRAIHPRYVLGETHAGSLEPVQETAEDRGFSLHGGAENTNKLIDEVPKRPSSNLDKYIELILKGVTNVDEFIYLLKNKESDDPYDLRVIDYAELKKSDGKEYYTISMKGLTHYVGGKPVEFISLAYWLKERDTYDRIKSLSFFVKFRKWKTLKMWVRNVTRYKTAGYKKALEEKLFLLNPVLGPTLLKHRQLCCEMESLRFVDLSQQVEVQPLGAFASNQEKKRKYVNERVQEFSKLARENVREGFKQCLDNLRKKKSTTPVDDEYAKKNDNQPNMVRLKESAYENLGFPDNMSYEKRSELRKECSRFIRFSYLVDFLALESLSNIYTSSVNDLITELQTLNEESNMIILRGEQQHLYKASKSHDPLFFVKLEFHPEPVPDDEIDLVEVERFEVGTNEEKKPSPSEFDILAHVYLEEEINLDGKQLDEDEINKLRAEREDSMKFYQKIPKNIHNKWISINPNLDGIFSTLLRSFHEGMNSLQAFERWSKHDELTPYASVLEEWDDMVGDDWDIPESNFLNPHSWIKVSAFNDYGTQVRELLEISFSRAEKYIGSFKDFLVLDWKNSLIDFEIFKNEKLAHPVDTFQNTFALLEWEKENFEKEIPHTADIGLLRIDSKQIKNRITPSPVKVQKEFQKFLPGLIRERLDKINDWLSESIARLSIITLNIDQYVQQTMSLKEITRKFPEIKDSINIIQFLYTIFTTYNIEVTKDDHQNLSKTIKSKDQLNEVIMKAEDGAERNLQRFAKDVQEKLIPVLNKEVGELEIKVTEAKYLTREITMEQAIEELEAFKKEFIVLDENAKRYNRYEETLNLAMTNFENVQNLNQELSLRLDLWKSLKEWKELSQKWISGKFNQIDTDEIKTKGDYYTKIVMKCKRGLAPNPILNELTDLVFQFKETMPIVLALRNKYLTDNHMKEIREVIGNPDFIIDDELTLSDLINMNIVQHQQKIQEISTQATQESLLYGQLQEIKQKWESVEFTLNRYKPEKIRDMNIIVAIDEIIELKDESLANLNNILGSRYLKYHREYAEKRHKDLLLVEETIEQWLTCQRNWIYLQNIFESSDIRKQLSVEAGMFEKVDKGFKEIMKRTAQNQNVLKQTAYYPSNLQSLIKFNESLNQIQKRLEDYLERKRGAFPRFYFLSNDELLEILANSAVPQSVQPHLKKCFDNIYKLDFGDDPKSYIVYGMISAEGEKVKFSVQTATKNEVEGWLNSVQNAMVDTLFKLMKAGLNDYYNKGDLKKWVMAHPGQIVSTVSQIVWCSNTEAHISEGTLDEWHGMNIEQLNKLTDLVKTNLDDIKRRIIVALITTSVHARDIVDNLREENVSSVNDFIWQKQLRYYWDEAEDNVIVRQVNANLKYGYEYMGATTRLVITPLTDRCWITITGAINIKLGAAPAGPAGTGKTESTKDLAKGLGMFCVVFNCSEQIDYKMMGRLFSGLAQQGAWACLDEFNRIDIEVLSVIAQQLLQIRQAQLRADEKFTFMDQIIPLKPTCGVFITMNPGYAGRTELPDNLKVLFRPVSMMIPDYALIAEIMLYAEGFMKAAELSKKMVRLYKLSSEQLSQQHHYDFGMRAVKSVLVMAGSLKRSQPNLGEDQVLIRAMKDSNIPKFLKDDIPLFQAIVQDLFPKVEIPPVDYGDLRQAILHSLEQLNMQKVEKFVTKIIQLFETFNVRFGVMLVGQTGSGKTTCYEALQKAMTFLRQEKNHADPRYQVVHTYVLNPKSISMGELFGEVHSLTKEWNDGLGSSIMRAAANDESIERKWVVFDGPVDALWIENMNTVLDDNMMLCLSNGQRIKLRSEMRMLFEVQDLAVASPATVSRCGMVYLTFEDLTWRPYVDSWMHRTFPENQLPPEIRKHLYKLFEDNIDPCLDKIRNHMTEPIATTDLQLVKSLTNLLEVFLSEEYGFKKNEKIEKVKTFISFSFAYAFTWSFGASVSDTYQDKLSDLIRERFQNFVYPSPGSVYSFYFDPEDLTFKEWDQKLKTQEFVYEKDIPYWNLLVPTADTLKYSEIMEWLIHYRKPVFVTGGSGVGKSVIIQNLLRKITEPRQIDPMYLIFSAQTSSQITQSTIEGKINKNKITKTLYGARPGRKNIIFIDDINMPTKEQYGAQPPIELLRQLVDKGGFYDRKQLFWKTIKDTILLACAAPPGGGRSVITPRFTRHFHVLCMPQPSQETLRRIFNSIMNGFLSVGFQESVKRLGELIVQSTIEIYQRILVEKPPIPSKFHYTFNLRDVSKVFQGILMCKSSIVREPEQMSRLWVHESSRVFHDRLINNEDRLWFGKLIEELVNRNLRYKWTYEEMFQQSKIYFGDLLKIDSGIRDYEEIKDTNKLQKFLENKLLDYNLDHNKKMNLVFFDDCMEHIMRIARILRQPRGNAMLIGVGGSGKQSLTRLCTYLLDYELFQIELTKAYNSENFKEDLRKLMKKTGIEGKPVVFLFIDTQIIHEGFLEDINNILNSGEVPNLWEQEDMDNIITEMRPINQALGRIEELETIYRTFIERVRNNLHIVLCMSPIGDALRVRCRQFPSLVDCCTLDWFSAWPYDALFSVGKKILSEVELPSEEIRNALAEMCPEVHISATEMGEKFYQELRRKVYTTPKSYLDLLNLFLNTLQEKREELTNNYKRLSTGITKLEETNKTVATLQVTLTELQPQLEQQTEKTKIALEAVKADTIKANEQEMIVAQESENIARQTLEIRFITDQAKAELDKALPELQAAEQALQNLKREDFDQIRKFNNPPKMVTKVMDAVSVLLGEKGEGDWAQTRAMLNNVQGFMDKLLNYKKDNIPESTLIRLRKYLSMPEFVPEQVRQSSSACELLCMWCISINKFAIVSKTVEPKKKKAMALQAQLDEANLALSEKQSQLEAVKANVARLTKECEEMVLLQTSLEERMLRCKVHLERAEKLKYLLADEGKRWTETVKLIQEMLISMLGDVFLSTAAISYLGPFTGPYRNSLLGAWIEKVKEKKIPVSEDFSLIKTLGNPVFIRDWILNGLPSDLVSQDNSILTTKGYRWPLLIDPQLQANKWVKNMEAVNQLRVTKFSNANFSSVIKGCLESGYPVLIQDVDVTLDPSIDSILEKQFYKDENGGVFIRFGDKAIPYDSRFKLYISTKIPNPHYLPEIFIKTTVINFTVTFEGLEDQLLGDVVKNERPDIEEQRDQNIVKLAGYKKELKSLEDNILRMLAESRGEILDNVELIQSLENSKQTATDIAEKLIESSKLEQKIELTRNLYKPASTRGSILYFVISDLSLIDPMYQYSLQYIKRLFNYAMQIADKSDNLEERLDKLIDKITKTIYLNVCRGLFEAHKVIFSFLIATSIKRQTKELDSKLWSVFLRGAGVMDKEKEPKNPDPKTIGSAEWDLAYYLDINFDKYKGLCQDIITRIDTWEELAHSYTIVEDPLPQPWKEKLDSFDKLLVVKILRPEKVLLSVQDYVIKQLGSFYMEGLDIKMESLYKDSDRKTPIIFVLSQGADPTSMILKFANERGMREKLFTISLGQGQGVYAEELIEKGIKEGSWVLLQNCHLARTWMPRLEIIIEEFSQKEEEINPDFRLFLTSMPDSYFPVSVLQNGIKLTTEPPRGLKNNMKRSFGDISQEFLDECPKKEAMHKLMFGLAFFHAVIQERKKFGPLGWNIKYEFNDSDLDTSKTVLKMLLTEQEQIPWDALLFVTGDINYGGRVTDDWDRRCLLSILKKYYTTEILEDKYFLSESETYYVPPVGTVEQYRSYIESLPITEDPEVFGMHENANVTYQVQESEKLIQTILSIQPRVTEAMAGKSNDDVILELAQQILEDLPIPLTREEGNKELFVENEQGLIPSLSTVLLQEMARFNKLLETCKSSLINMQKAIKGIILMSPELDKMYSSLLNNQVPLIWEKVAYPSLKPLASWIKDLKERVEFMRSWLINGNPNSYWLSGLFFPQGFVTGVLQTHARKYEIAIDKLSFSFRILDFDKDQLQSRPSDGVYVYGLYLEGAIWDKKRKTLADQHPGEMHFLMPLIHFNPAVDYESKPQDYNCPVYKTSVRAGVLSTTGHSTNFILAVDLPTNEFPPETWVLRGTALLCQLND